MQSRRNFIKVLGLGAAAFSLPNINLFASTDSIPNLGIQLYTVRYEIEKDFEIAVKRIAEIGYKGIESYPLPENITLKYASKVFHDAGLEVFSIHSELPVGQNLETALKTTDAYNSKLVVYHGWPEDDKYKGEDNLKSTVELYNEIGEKLKSHGLQFGLHNHWWEFEKVDGIIPFYYLLENLNDAIFFEIDTYWAKTAGMNPAEIIEDFGKRAKLLHIKDGPAVKGDAMYAQVPVGSGNVDFQSVYSACKDNTEWMIVEFDEYERNIFDGIDDSYDYLTKNKFAVGNR
ncbi:MAG: sugar phosphate isomerase/epimerase [Melioribacteraceae bacterium]|nr:sugar phosphate isomerase/epimerase [Melioribacteraceae bacterium]MCF8354179.1 sugar phosphate isomerase/epimerase [Melioribacteraceae bacterium]MCF8394717.1 sugar phosphate isomerase/epimerase [Melioribacteraceae bacterium]MCF8418102.1 sugar phosphate isomerase/epimerase [Melioribacteraceae bacterium]